MKTPPTKGNAQPEAGRNLNPPTSNSSLGKLQVYEPHPLALMVPSMDDEAIDALAADIKANGLLNAIVLYEDKILDGIQRQEACRRAGVQPLYLQFILLSRAVVKAGALAYVISQNLHRRHLNESQRSVIAAKLANLPAHRPNKSANLPPSVSQPEAAKLLKVSERSVRTAKLVIREAEHDKLKAECLVNVIAGKKRLASVKPKPRKVRPEKAVPFSNFVFARFERFIKYWPVTEHRDVKRELVTCLLGRYERTIGITAPVSVIYPDGSKREIADMFR